MLSKCYPILRISYYICYMIKTKYLKIITAISLTSILALQLMWLCNTYILIRNNISEEINQILYPGKEQIDEIFEERGRFHDSIPLRM